MSKKHILFIIIAVIFALLSAWLINNYLSSNISVEQNNQGNTGDDIFCIQLITPAKNPETNEIVDFPTPCDVPDGWVVLERDVVE